MKPLPLTVLLNPRRSQCHPPYFLNDKLFKVAGEYRVAQNLTLDLCGPAAIQEHRQVNSDTLAKDKRGPSRLGVEVGVGATVGMEPGWVCLGN